MAALEAHFTQGPPHRGLHLVGVSSSSVYYTNTNLPFSEHQSVAHPVSLYAASKKANELRAHTYRHLYGRPEMALFLFTRAMLAGEPIRMFNHGRMVRDFTYVDDIIESLIRVLNQPARPDPEFDLAHPDPATSWAPHRLFNIGNSQPIPLMDYIEALEEALENWIGFAEYTLVAQGVARFVVWYRSF